MPNQSNHFPLYVRAPIQNPILGNRGCISIGSQEISYAEFEQTNAMEKSLCHSQEIGYRTGMTIR